jgi:hypothetical protein
MERIYRADVTLTVPQRDPSGRTVWTPTRLSGEGLAFIEFVRSPEECGPLVARIGGIVVQRLNESQHTGFRIAARGVTTRILCGMGEWTRRNRYEPFENVFVWSATWDDLPATCRQSALYALERVS